MLKETDLLSYLPVFLRKYDETEAALNAENPEFNLLWEQSARVLREGFIETADEYGTERFERLLGIYPSEETDLEERRKTVLARWLLRLPYTYRMLLRQLYGLCGNDFTVVKGFETDYFLQVVTHIRNWAKTPEVRRLIYVTVPANICTEYYNSILIKTENPSTVYSGARLGGMHKKIKVML